MPRLRKLLRIVRTVVAAAVVYYPDSKLITCDELLPFLEDEKDVFLAYKQMKGPTKSTEEKTGFIH